MGSSKNFVGEFANLIIIMERRIEDFGKIGNNSGYSKRLNMIKQWFRLYHSSFHGCT